MKKRIAVVGGGIYGVTVAIKLAKKYSVDLYEKNDDILSSASGINQFRLHRGYHYPRSKETIEASLQDAPIFEKEYAKSIMKDVDHYYCIAKKNSVTSPEQYLKVLNKYNLEHSLTTSDVLNMKNIAICVQGKEYLIDPEILKKLCWEKINKSGVKIKLKTEATEEMIDKYDYFVNCTYTTINSLLKNYPAIQRDYQYELCEKIVVKMPKEFNNKSIVIMDGPFMCVDPYGNTDLFLWGNVVHAIHQTNIGKNPIFDKKYKPLLNRGIIKNCPETRFKLFVKSGVKFIPAMDKAEYVGSMFTFRTVLPKTDKTDDRPKIVQKINDKVITVFAGKLANCVDAAKEVEGLVK